jgi:hypothetical protein
MQERNLLSKVPKISTLFASSSSASTVSDETGDLGGRSSDVPPDMTSQHGDEGASELSTTNVPTAITAAERPVTSNDPFDPYSCDLGLWPNTISNSMREYWGTKGSSDCRNSDADFSSTSTLPEGDKYMPEKFVPVYAPTNEGATSSHLALLLTIPTFTVLFCMQVDD